MSVRNRVFNSFNFSWRSRLSRQIVLLLFMSLFAVEGILLIPSLGRKKQELLSQIRSVTEGKLTWVLQDMEQATPEELLARFQQLQQVSPQILGGAIYTPDGKLVGEFGEMPERLLAQLEGAHQRQLYQESRYDKAWKVSELPIEIENQQLGDYTLVLCHDASSINSELYSYALRILGLVTIIAAVTTLTLRLALEPIVIQPVLQLKRDLIKAGVAVSQDCAPPLFRSATLKRNDELGDVIVAFEQMFERITEAIQKRKLAESALQESLAQLQQYSEKLDAELQEGRQMQQNFLPPAEAINCLLLDKQRWEIATFFKPARQVSGDFYDVFELPDGYLGLVIADVCGKGVGAALFMALFRSLIRIYAMEPEQGSTVEVAVPPALEHQCRALQAVALTNDYIAEHHGSLGMFATLFFGVLDPATGSVTYINGGHESLAILGAQGQVRETLHSTGPAVGMFAGQAFEIRSSSLQPGETLVGYTDGIPEARAANGAFYTRERLLGVINLPTASAAALLERIAASVFTHTGQAEQFDDMTLLAVQWTASLHD
ncbi:MAG: PP2C family protein-serine/threonine phosphatase [Cyanophyceae cyanobacterium]